MQKDHHSEKVAIVLSTYNGAKYIAQQLDALIAQTHGDWRCYIRDDGSRDDTVAILKQYAQKDTRIYFLDDQLGNMGLNNSHYHLLKIPTENYIATCDQDDVWLPEKLELSLKKLIEIETAAHLPALVHTDSLFVDSNLNLIRPQFIGKRGLKTGLNGIIFANSVQGGSILMNKALNQVAVTIPPVLPYDYHLGIIAELIGVRAFIPQTLLKYRQHSASSISTADNRASDSNKHVDEHSISKSLQLSLGNYQHIKHDFNSITPNQQANSDLLDYLYIFEGRNPIKKLWLLLKNSYPFYRRKDLIQLIVLIVKNKPLILPN